MTCPCGRNSAPKSIRSASRSSRSASTPSAPTPAARSSRRPSPTHPSLIDRHHAMAELFGVINIPNSVWIDEQGMIVRPAEAAPPPRRLERPATTAEVPASVRGDHRRGLEDPHRRRRVPRRAARLGRPRRRQRVRARPRRPSSRVPNLAMPTPPAARPTSNWPTHLESAGHHDAAVAPLPRGTPTRSRQLLLQAAGVVARARSRRRTGTVLAGPVGRRPGCLALRRRLADRRPRVRRRELLPGVPTLMTLRTRLVAGDCARQDAADAARATRPPPEIAPRDGPVGIVDGRSRRRRRRTVPGSHRRSSTTTARPPTASCGDGRRRSRPHCSDARCRRRVAGRPARTQPSRFRRGHDRGRRDGRRPRPAEHRLRRPAARRRRRTRADRRRHPRRRVRRRRRRLRRRPRSSTRRRLEEMTRSGTVEPARATRQGRHPDVRHDRPARRVPPAATTTTTSSRSRPCIDRIPLRLGDTQVVAAPMFHSWGLSHLLLGLARCTTTVVSRRFDPERTLAAVADHRRRGARGRAGDDVAHPRPRCDVLAGTAPRTSA